MNFRVLEKNRKNKTEKIVCPLGTKEQVMSRIRTMKKCDSLFGVKGMTYKPIEIK